MYSSYMYERGSGTQCHITESKIRKGGGEKEGKPENPWFQLLYMSRSTYSGDKTCIVRYFLPAPSTQNVIYRWRRLIPSAGGQGLETNGRAPHPDDPMLNYTESTACLPPACTLSKVHFPEWYHSLAAFYHVDTYGKFVCFRSPRQKLYTPPTHMANGHQRPSQQYFENNTGINLPRI
ncbi:hypothetical protein P167DRAFT_541906 [Morchella conica CCBAS932]|uniref:Uncharacterized protein n=1 Tax=Morchella conica CCBAS932 TaxID=1392247 RepID=A0A3N4L168_9PEZI|nr:hypothetical protein P167DRAFT_541906 [Morchella conica CCBAS932]